MNESSIDTRTSSRTRLGRRFLRGDVFLTISLCSAMNAGTILPAVAEGWQTPAAIVETARRFVMETRVLDTDSQSVDIQPPDRRLRLPACDTSLRATSLSPDQRGTRMTVKVFCDGERQWKVYVQAKISSYEQVVVARHNLPRGHTLAADDIVLARRSIGELAGGYLSLPDSVVGRTLTQTVTAGQQIQASQIRRPVAVRRGQMVALVSNHKGIAIRMSGTALADGAIGSRLAVRNASSGTIVEGTLTDAATVRIGQ